MKEIQEIQEIQAMEMEMKMKMKMETRSYGNYEGGIAPDVSSKYRVQSSTSSVGGEHYESCRYLNKVRYRYFNGKIT